MAFKPTIRRHPEDRGLTPASARAISFFMANDAMRRGDAADERYWRLKRRAMKNPRLLKDASIHDVHLELAIIDHKMED